MSRFRGWLRRKIFFRLGMNFYLATEDRRVLEQVIFPYIVARSDLNRILFVGCEIYTRGYAGIFRHKDYQTLDVNAQHRIYGARKHIVDSFERISEYYTEGALDVVICNGVFGWGLDDPAVTYREILGFASHVFCGPARVNHGGKYL